MEADELTIKETTQAAIGDRLVAVANIWERDLPDDAGVVASRLSASVFIADRTTNDSQRHTVAAGSTLRVGDAHYRVIDIEEGGGGLGSITLRKITT